MVEKFCFIRDVLHKEVEVRPAVTAIIRAGWKKFRDFLCKKGLSLKLKGILYKVYVRSVLRYNAEYSAV